MRKTPLTLGVLSMVFGGLITAQSALSLAFSNVAPSFMSNFGRMLASAPRRPGEPDPSLLFTRMSEAMKPLMPYLTALTLAKLLFSIALIIVGYGLYKRQRWGRSGAIGWGALALVYLAAEMVVNVGIVQPRMQAAMVEAFGSLPNGAASAAMMQSLSGSQSIMAVVGALVFWAPFPVVLLALCGRRSAAADFVD